MTTYQKLCKEVEDARLQEVPAGAALERREAYKEEAAKVHGHLISLLREACFWCPKFGKKSCTTKCPLFKAVTKDAEMRKRAKRKE